MKIFPELVFPESDGAEAFFPKLMRDLSMPSPIPFDLGRPEGLVRFRYMPASWTTVPETAIDKHSELLIRKVEIRLAWEGRFIANPSVNPTSN